jgi:hypothetical protein
MQNQEQNSHKNKGWIYWAIFTKSFHDILGSPKRILKSTEKFLFPNFVSYVKMIK